MSKINKIKLSGTTYDVEDLNAVHSLAGYATSAETQAAITAATDALAESIAEQGYQTATDVQNAITGKADTTAVTQVINALTGHTSNTTVHVTSTDKTNWDNKVSVVEYASASWIPGATRLRSTKDGVNYNNFAYVSPINGKAILSDGSNINQFSLVETSAITTAITSGSTNDEVPSAKAMYDKFDVVEQVTAAALNELNDAISGKVDTSTYNTYTAATDTALASKQDTLSAGTGISISGNVISATGGGGKAIEAGRGIAITTGETADTISFNLPISAGTGTGSIVANGNSTKATGSQSFAEGYATTASGYSSHAEGYATTASSTSSHAEGRYTTANGNYSHAEGDYTIANNRSEHASGQYNVSSKASTTFGNSGNTLFSVGNGTADNARHNAFEIRQNGDIYLTKDGQDVKLQDQLGGGGSITVDTALDSGSTNPVENRVIYNKIDEIEQVSSAALNVLNEKLVEDEEVTAAALNKLNDAISGKVDTSTYNTYTAATDTALASKQTTLSAGTGISIVDNVISATGGGGKAISAGTNISVTTGETADTINCTLNAKNGTGSGSIIFGNTANVSNQQFSVAFGSGTQAKGIASIAEGESTQTTDWYCHSSGYKTLASGKWSNAEGYQTTASTQYSHTEGIGTKVTNNGEHSQGMYNTSSSDGTTSGNTLFSVGNGTANNARHNAFEIRQNGDIYLNDGTNDVKLQDTITATAANTTALGGLSLVKLSQTEYNNLQTKDNNTLYVIVN